MESIQRTRTHFHLTGGGEGKKCQERTCEQGVRNRNGVGFWKAQRRENGRLIGHKFNNTAKNKNRGREKEWIGKKWSATRKTGGPSAKGRKGEVIFKNQSTPDGGRLRFQERNRIPNGEMESGGISTYIKGKNEERGLPM